MKVREIKNYDLCRNGSQVWLKKFDRETEAYKTIASTDKRFETAGNLMYFEGCGLFWMSNDFNSVARYEECDGEMHFFGFIRQRPLFSEGEVFYTIEPDEKQPGEVKCLGKRLINRPDFWVFVRQKKGQLVVSYPEPHDNSRDLFMRPGQGIFHGEGISYTFEEKVFPGGFITPGEICETDEFGLQLFKKERLFKKMTLIWHKSKWPGAGEEKFDVYNSPGLF